MSAKSQKRHDHMRALLNLEDDHTHAIRKTPRKRYDRYIAPEEQFKTLDEFAAALHAEQGSHCPDYLGVAGILFTMEEFDSEGKYITYANRRNELQIQVETSNRYSSTGCADAKVWIWAASWHRNDISYAD